MIKVQKSLAVIVQVHAELFISMHKTSSMELYYSSYDYSYIIIHLETYNDHS